MKPLLKLGIAALIGYILTIFAANLAISLVGIVPVGLGLMAPAGVYFAGLAFTLRDAVQETLGRRWTVVAILTGALISAALSAQLALASGVAFLVSELADFAVYTPLRRRAWLAAVVASNTVGVMLDSALFLWLAFGSLDFLAGQIVGKLWMTALAVGLILLWRSTVGARRARAADETRAA
ncbi:MAG: VUT family protein [Chloroflexota bacterium]